MSKVLKKLVDKNKKIEMVDKEEDGYFVYTANGWCWGDDGCHTRAFDTVKEVLGDLWMIEPCSGREGCCS